MNNKSEILEHLYSIISSRKDSDPEASYTAHLFAKGTPEIARKLGEEAVETITAALVEEDKSIIRESADLLYHLLVLWAEKGIVPSEVWDELTRREGTSGIDEKAGRHQN